MVKQVNCPGCKRKYTPGRSYSQHVNSCKKLDSATDKALKNHKIAISKKAEEKKAEIARRKELKLVAQELQNATGDQGMHVEVELFPNATLSPSPPPPPPPRASGRPGRHIRKPLRYRDIMPANPPIILVAAPTLALAPESEENDAEELEEQFQTLFTHSADPSYQTETNSFGVYRKYAHGTPTITPDEYFTLSSVSDSITLAHDPAESHSKASWWSSFGPSSLKLIENTAENYFSPFLNASTFLLMAWFYNGSSTKSFADIDKLIHNVIRNEDFKALDFDTTFSTAREAERMDKHNEAESSSKYDNTSPGLSFSPEDGWMKGSVSIPVPCDGFKFNSENDAPQFTVDGIWYRRPLEVLKMAFSEPAALKFVTTPYKEYWKPSENEPEERIYGETYTADVFNDEYDELRSKSRTGPNSHLEPFVAGIIFYSDATHLANFGDASLWPLYMYIGNQSKYTRAQPGEFAAHHIAYIPKLKDEIQDWYKKTFGKVATAAMLTHLRREIVQAIWMLLLDDDLIRAYEEGEAVRLFDNILRAMFPRFLFYSMDYPEKTLMSCIKFLGKCMCPRCCSLKENVRLVGSKSDLRNRTKLARIDSETRRFDIELVRKLLFEKGVNITSNAVKAVLDPTSAVPTRNAFSQRLSKFGFNFYRLFTVDFMHEIEIGDWKALFIHLLRILYAHGNDSIQSLNWRYRHISPFGRATIRKFAKNASAMKKLAARDFEDLLQCASPVFEGLLPKLHDQIVQRLLFELATWHALAKLRLHTDSTLEDLNNSSTRLCDLLRKFKKDVCSAYATRDLPSEEAARGRRKAAKVKKTAEVHQPKSAKVKPTKGSKIREYNMSTYKLHSIPDYGPSICANGTIDNTSSQSGESEHKRSKQFYPRVRKGDHVRGIARHVYRERALFRARARHAMKENQATLDIPSPLVDEEVLTPTPPEDHHHISKDVRHKVDVPKWLADNRKDPALVNFLPNLKDHLLGRIIHSDNNLNEDTKFTNKERSRISILNNRIYKHKVLRINYTTYDMRRAQDSLNLQTRGDIMVLSREEDPQNSHPYWYARIIGIFHAMVVFKGAHNDSKWSEPTIMQFIFVRWFGLDTDEPGGWKAKRLHQIGFLDGSDPSAFGFIDPADVIRAVHLIPRFSLGQTSDLLGPSIARSESSTGQDEDWIRYYVNVFADRDMVMRYRGGGVGHASARAATDVFRKDRDAMDIYSRESRQKSEHMEGQEYSNNDEFDGVDNQPPVNNEEDISESELVDYGYDDDDEEEEEEEEEVDGNLELEGSGDEDQTNDEPEELAALGFAEY